MRILHLEDSPIDGELIQETLSHNGVTCDSVRVDNKDDFLAALQQGGVDLILADYSLPSFDGISALELAKQTCPDVPFIFVSATLGEELAVETLKEGATDYVLKQRLGRLVPSVNRALRDMQDRTERKRAEEALRDREQQLQQSQKMEALGRLAGGIVHDFNNLLTIIMGYSQVLLNQLGNQHPLASQIRESQEAVRQAASLIRQLLAFSRKQVMDPRLLNINLLVQNLEGMMDRLIGDQIKLVVEKEPLLGSVKSDQSQLEQVLMNLVVNARDAMPQGGTLTIQTENVEIPSPPGPTAPPLEPGRYVTLSISDTGHGMDPDTQAKIFEPFFTTKEEGKGTGLGLSTVHGIVKQSGGWISVHSVLNQGTRFTVYFPHCDDPSTAQAGGSGSAPTLGGHETILLVEDDVQLRQSIREQLQRLGYRVLEARNVFDAFLISNQEERPIHLLLADVIMPGMSGQDLAQQLTSVRPHMKVLYMSGYADDIGVTDSLNPAKMDFLVKPFSNEVLAGKVRALLNR